MRWPWQPRKYVVVTTALRRVESALEEMETEAKKQRKAVEEVRTELGKGQRDRRQ